jgi:hypothetical protein
MKQTYSFDFLFDADLKGSYRKMWTIADIQREAAEEEFGPATLGYHMTRPKIKESRWDRFVYKLLKI